jgi:hypothetical protein
MVEMRWVLNVLQYRYMKIGVDASGALCPNGGWSEWIDVPTVTEE